MSKGYLVIAQNSNYDYVRMAYALALSITNTQRSVRRISIAVDNALTNNNVTFTRVPRYS